MNKTHVNITVDGLKWEKARKRGINMSQLVNNVLNGLYTNDEINGINVNELHNELIDLRNQREAITMREVEILTILKEGESKLNDKQKKSRRDAEKMVDAIKASGALYKWEF